MVGMPCQAHHLQEARPSQGSVSVGIGGKVWAEGRRAQTSLLPHATSNSEVLFPPLGLSPHVWMRTLEGIRSTNYCPRPKSDLFVWLQHF